MTKVLIAGESDVLRKGLEALVKSDPALDPVGSLENLSDLEQLVEEAAPDVVVLAAEADTIGVWRDFTDGGADSRRPPLVVVGFPRAYSAGEMLRAGVAALLPQDARGDEILAAVHAAAAGLLVLHPGLVESAGDRPRQSVAPVTPLSPRELEVLTMLAEGLGNKEVAWRLRISEHTVKFHVTSIFTKLDVSSRAEAVSIGFRLGLILI
ncbi:MAG: response regulator transcription factor [Terriglobia bacterium]